MQSKSSESTHRGQQSAPVLSEALKAKWIAALRSEKFKQARGKLKDGQAYCCLGVLCKVARIPLTKNGMFPQGADDYRPIWDLLRNEHAGRTLATMNDGRTSFLKIADYIETNVPAALAGAK